MKYLLITVVIIAMAVSVKAQNTENVKKVLENGEEVYTALKNPPYFQDGVHFLANNLRIPASVREKNIHGTVVVVFIIEKDGTLSNFKILSSPSNEMSDEVIRMFKSTPKWNPGMVDGKPVRFLFNFPVNF